MTTTSIINDYNKYKKNVNPNFLKVSDKAISNFKTLGLPNKKIENWRFSSVAPFFNESLSVHFDKLLNLSANDKQSILNLVKNKENAIVFVDGFYREEFSKTKKIKDKITILPLVKAMQNGTEKNNSRYYIR